MDNNEVNHGELSLSSKYQRLAAEYAKIRSQVSVLKRGIIDEQNKSSELKDELNEKEKSIRKYEQEIDSYSFRNQQLEKRVSILQNDLSELQLKISKKGDNKKAENSAPAYSEHFPTNDLFAKIDENIQLSIQLSQQEDNFKKELKDLTNSYEDKLKKSNDLHKDIISKYETEQISFSQCLAKANEDIRTYKNKIKDLEDASVLFNESLSIISSKELENESKNLIQSQSQTTSNLLDEDNFSNENKDKLTNLQIENEQLKLEYEILKMKSNKIFMKFEECKTLLKNIGQEEIINKINEVTTPDGTVTNFIGKMEVITNSLGTQNFEEELTTYFMKRINELICLLQLCDSKALTFYNDCKSLQMHLILNLDEKRQLETKYEEINSKFEQLSEELQLVKSTYESQLQTLTEHIANMNDKLAQQQEKIDHYEYQIKNTGASGSGKKK